MAGSLVSTHLEILSCAENCNPNVVRVRMVIGTSFASHLDIVVKQLLLFQYDTGSLQPEETIIHKRYGGQNEGSYWKALQKSILGVEIRVAVLAKPIIQYHLGERNSSPKALP